MARIILAALATLCAVHVQASTVEDTHYVAAVVDYTAPVDYTVTPEKNILNNIEAFEVFVSNASTQGVDIIVFPEEGLKGFAVQSFPMSVPAAEDKVTPCVAPSSPEPLKRLSCMASKYAIYLVVNLVHQVPCTKAQDAKCPTRGYYNYNTNVAFDRKGKIVARYHKYNLFGERDNNVPPTVEYVTFDTDFGVRFGMFICFDILFDKPAAQLARERNVTDFVFSAAWFSEVPFLSAVQAHSAWAHSLDVTLLAAAYNYPATGATGSGIYRGRDGILAYVFNPRTESTMLVSKVPKHGHWRDAAVTPLPELSRLDPLVNYASGAADPYDSVKPLKMIVDHVNDFVTTPLPRLGFGDTQQVHEKLCHNDFCCTFRILVSGTHLHPMRSAAASIHGTSSRARQEETDPDDGGDVDGLHYRLAVFSGVRDHSGAATTGVQICGIMSCRNESQSTCGPNVPHLNQPTVQWTEFVAAIIHAEYDQDTLQFASTQAGPRYDPLPANLYDYEISDWLDNKRQVTIELKKSIVDLRTFAIYGRKFAWDGLPATH